MKESLFPEDVEKRNRIFKLIGMWEMAINSEENFIPAVDEVFKACAIMIYATLDSTNTPIKEAKDIFEEMFNIYCASIKTSNPSSSSEGSQVDQPGHLGS